MATRQQRVAAAAEAAEVRGASAQQLSGLRREVAELAALEDTTRCTLRHLQRMRADLDQALAGGEREEWGWSVGPRALATWLPDALAMASPPTPPAPPLTPPPPPRPARTLREALDLDSASGAGVGAWPGSGAVAAGAAAAQPGSTDATTTAASLLFCSLVVLREVRAEVRRLRLRMRTRRRAGAGGASRPEEAEEDAMAEADAEAEAVAAAAVAAAGAAAGAAQAAATPEGAERARGGGDAPPADLDAALRGLQPQEQVTVLRAERLRLLREIAAARAEAELRRRLLRGTAGGGEALRQRSSLYEPDDDASIEAARGGPHGAHAPLAPDNAAPQSLADGRNAPLRTAYTGQRPGRAYPSDMEGEAEEEDGGVLSMGPSSPAMAAGALEDGEDEDADSEDGALPDVTGPAEDEEGGEAVGEGEDADERQDEARHESFEEGKGEGELNAELRSNEASASSLAPPLCSQGRRRNEQSAANARVGGAAVAESGESTAAPSEANEDVMGALPDLP